MDTSSYCVCPCEHANGIADDVKGSWTIGHGNCEVQIKEEAVQSSGLHMNLTTLATQDVWCSVAG
jgi:hypothetical protein